MSKWINMSKRKWFFAVLALAAVIAGVWYYTSDDEDDDEDEEVSEYVTTRQSLLEARLALLNNRFLLMESSIQLYKALGGGN